MTRGLVGLVGLNLRVRYLVHAEFGGGADSDVVHPFAAGDNPARFLIARLWKLLPHLHVPTTRGVSTSQYIALWAIYWRQKQAGEESDKWIDYWRQKILERKIAESWKLLVWSILIRCVHKALSVLGHSAVA
jgi:hypothetical protein